MFNYEIGSFHMLIITAFSLLFLNGCGFKSDPYWVDTNISSSGKTEEIIGGLLDWFLIKLGGRGLGLGFIISRLLETFPKGRQRKVGWPLVRSLVTGIITRGEGWLNHNFLNWPPKGWARFWLNGALRN